MSTTPLVYEGKLEHLITSDPIADPAWLVDLRGRATEAHRQLGLPTPKNEEWKYTPLRPIAESNLQPSEPGPAWFDPELPRFEPNSLRIVLVNGRFDRNLSDQTAAPGLRAQSLRDVLHERPDLVADRLGSRIDLESFTFAALNTASFVDGALIHLHRGTQVEPLIEIIHVTAGDNLLICPRVVIVAEEGATVRIVETYVSRGTGSLCAPVTEVFVESRAVVEHVRVQDEETTAFHIGHWEVAQAADSVYRSTNVAFGASLGRTDQNITLDGEHCETRLDGVVVATGQQLLDNHTRLDHAVPNCNSFEIYKQVIDGEASVVFNGKILVRQDAQKTDAKQTNQALLLSDKATINSKPQLEIFADDVKCTHGATVGQLEDLPLFYLRQRGIPAAEARSILVYAFAAEVLELITVESVRDALEARLFAKLGLDQS